MFLRRFLSNTLVSALVAVGGSAVAATYEVTTEEDGAGINQVADEIANDGNCTLREAINAITWRVEVDACPAGTGSDVVLLKEGVTYPLVGEIELGGGQTTGDTPVDINPSVRIGVIPLGPFDETIKENAVILAASGSRIFHVKPGARLVIDNVTLDGGATNPLLNVDGGLVLVEGNLSAKNHAVFRNGRAANGGAVYFDSDNASFSVTDAAFLDNTASPGNGGAVAMLSTSRGSFLFDTFYFAGNSADGQGGAIYLDGTRPSLAMVNGTLYNNQAGVADGGVIRLQANRFRATAINNVTMAANAGGGGLSFNTTHVDAAGLDVSDLLSNSVLVGNDGGACVGDDDARQAADVYYVLHESAGGDCHLEADGDAFIQQGVTPGDGIWNDSGSANMSVLMGFNPDTGLVEDCPSTLPDKSKCQPVDLTTPEFVWPAYMPSRVDSIGANDGVPTVVNGGASASVSVNRCSSVDQRGLERIGDCDAGAIELVPARGNEDEFSVIAGTSKVIDVLANDLGDATVDCAGVMDCFRVTQKPVHGSVDVEIDVDGRPVVTYTAAGGFHGVDSFRYLVKKEAIVGAETWGNTDVGSLTYLVVAPASGLLESDSIGTGAAGLWSLVLLGLAGLARRARAGLVVLLSLLSLPALAAQIVVNSTMDADPPEYGDGFCTLREALANAQDSAPNPSPDCRSGVNGRDEIQLPEGTIQLVAPLDAGSNNVVDIRGKGADDVTVDGEFSAIDAQGNSRIFLLRSPTALYDLILENGSAVAIAGDGGAIITDSSLRLERVVVRDSAAVSGGAIFVNFNSQTDRAVELYRSHFEGNSASLNGGAFAINAAVADISHKFYIAGSSFINNSAQGNGGALDMNLPSRSAFRLANSTLANNTAGGRGDGIDLADVAGNAYIMNSTFVGHPSGLDLGDIDNAEVDISISNSVYLGDTSSGSCSTGSGRFKRSEYNVFAATKDGSCIAATETSNNTYDLAELQALLGTTAPAAAAGQSEEFAPGHFPIDPEDVNAAYLMDQGNGTPDKLEIDFNRPQFCRDVDTRGLSRTAGGQCDIGAYEVQQSTAVDDEASNQGRIDHVAIINVVGNDIAGDDLFLVPYAIDLQPTGAGDTSVQTTATTASGTLRLVEKEEVVRGERYDPQNACGADVGTNGAGPKECLVRYELTNPPVGGCVALDSFEDTFTYTFIANETDLPEGAEDYTATNPVPSMTGTVTVEIVNLPPMADNVSVVSTPGDTVVFPFNVIDVEGDPIGDFTLSQSPIAAKYDQVNQERVYLGVGVIVDQVGGTVTYIPASASSPFNDSFVLSYTDSCGAKGSTTFRVVYPQNDASGDVLGGGGSLSASGLLLLMLGLRRRRPKS